MDSQWTDLWTKLQDFDFDAAGTRLKFRDRLARENGWTPDFASAVIEEYRRFLFLAVAAGHPVTPSDQVDQAWHLHLTYTRSYWQDLCRDTLQQDLHHGPTKGGSAEQEKFNDWYARTLDSYQSFFGDAPPVHVWPPASIRFGDDVHFARVNTRRNWVIPKPWHQSTNRTTSLAAVPLAAGFGSFAFLGDTSIVSLLLIIAAAMMALMGIVSAIRGKNGRGGGGSGSGGGGFFGGFGDGGDGGGGDSGCGGGGCGGGCALRQLVAFTIDLSHLLDHVRLPNSRAESMAANWDPAPFVR